MRILNFQETAFIAGGKDSAAQGCVNGMAGAQAIGQTGAAQTAAACAAGAAASQSSNAAVSSQMGQMAAGGLAALGVSAAQGLANGQAPAQNINGDPDPGATSGSSGGDGSVICTQLARTGDIEHATWAASQRYTTQQFSQQVMNGYHVWGVPYVKLMRKSPVFAAIVKHPVTWFAEDNAYRMGVRAKPNYMGWALRELAFRPVCWSIGVFAKARDFQHLWTGKALAV